MDEDKLEKLKIKYSLSGKQKKTFQGEELRNLLEDFIEYNQFAFGGTIRKYKRLDAFDMAGRMIRGIEEFINLLFENIKDDVSEILAFPIQENPTLVPGLLNDFNLLLSKKNYHQKLIARLNSTYLQLSTLIPAFRAVGIDHQIDNVSIAIAYLQSRRAYLSTIQPLVIKYCEGEEKFEPQEGMAIFFPALECYLTGIGTLTDYQIIFHCLDDFQIQMKGEFPNVILESNFFYNKLEGLFLQPLRFPLAAIIKYSNTESRCAVPIQNTSSILSYEENLYLLESYRDKFDKFDLRDSLLFKEYFLLFKKMKKYLVHDYYIVISKTELMQLIQEIHGMRTYRYFYESLKISSDNFSDMLNSKAPFIELNGKLYSTITMFMRHLIYVAEDYLNGAKNFQIISGFIFEDVIKEILSKWEFNIEKIKRLKNTQGTWSEFDVVTTKDNIIYNFQCKNNYLDISNVKINCPKFKKTNYKLVMHYQKAYEEEIKKENLLLKELNKPTIKHFIISRYPIITRDKKIVTYQNLSDWLATKEYEK